MCQMCVCVCPSGCDLDSMERQKRFHSLHRDEAPPILLQTTRRSVMKPSVERKNVHTHVQAHKHWYQTLYNREATHTHTHKSCVCSILKKVVFRIVCCTVCRCSVCSSRYILCSSGDTEAHLSVTSLYLSIHCCRCSCCLYSHFCTRGGFWCS